MLRTTLVVTCRNAHLALERVAGDVPIAARVRGHDFEVLRQCLEMEYSM